MSESRPTNSTQPTGPAGDTPPRSPLPSTVYTEHKRLAQLVDALRIAERPAEQLQRDQRNQRAQAMQPVPTSSAAAVPALRWYLVLARDEQGRFLYADERQASSADEATTMSERNTRNTRRVTWGNAGRTEPAHFLALAIEPGSPYDRARQLAAKMTTETECGKVAGPRARWYEQPDR